MLVYAMVYLTAIWYILWPFGIFFPVLVCCAKKTLATLKYNEMTSDPNFNLLLLLGDKLAIFGPHDTQTIRKK
jgi:hypothetical protein